MRRAAISLLVYGALFATGSAGLIYQVAWQRYLSRLVGNDAIAIAITLAVFLSGLSLGYALCGRLTVGARNPLRIYAVIEALIGLWALGFPQLFAGVDRLAVNWRFAPPWGQTAEGLLVGAVLFLPPTLLMGATVPFMTRAATATAAGATRAHAAVYGVNTAGAFLGAIAASFFLIPRWGLPATLRMTSLLNLAAAALFAALSARRTEGLDLAGTGDSERPAMARFSARRLTGLAVLSGAIAMILENTLARFLSITIGGSGFVFSLVVAVFVLAIAAGSLVIAQRKRLPRTLLFNTHAAIALLLLGLFPLFSYWPYGAHLLRIGFAPGPSGYVFYYAAVLLTLVLLLGLPVALMGMTLPVVFHEIRPNADDAGRLSGRLLAWNAFGCLAGSLLGGIVLYAWLDTSRIYLIAPLLAALGALLSAGPLPRFYRLAAVMICLLALEMFFMRPGYRPEWLVDGTFRTRTAQPASYSGAAAFYGEFLDGVEILALHDDALCRVAVSETRQELYAVSRRDGHRILLSQTKGRALLVNGKSDSNTVGDIATLRLSAHLAALLSRRRERVLVIGLGTGVSAGELTLYPEVKRIDVAEISPTVADALPWFGGFTHRVHEDPRLKIELGDAILLLRRSRNKWDFITSEPSNLWVAGVEQLFTREFYKQVDDHLADGGVFVQWVHLYESRIDMLGTVVNTLHSQFPNLSAFRGSHNDLLLVASRHPLGEQDWLRVDGILQGNAAVSGSLGEIGAGSAGALRGFGLESFQNFVDGSPRYGLQTLDHPRLQAIATRAVFDGETVSEAAIETAAPPAAGP